MTEPDESSFAEMGRQTIWAQISFHALWTAAELGLADRLADGPKASEALARETGTHPPSLYRLLRALASVGAVREHGEGTFSLTPLGATLRSGPNSLRDAVRFFGHPFRMHAWEHLLHSVRTGERAFDQAYGVPVFDWLERHPEVGKVFDAAMSGLTDRLAKGLLATYDFAGIRVLVDVGGGRGTLLVRILERHPGIRGVLFEREQVAAAAREALAGHEVGPRCAVVTGNFFEHVPEGADAYLMKSIIHDWDDERSLTILRNCRNAMRPEGRVLLVERLVPGPGEPDESKLLDLEMLVIPGGRERTVAEFEALLSRAGLRLARVVPVEGGPSLLEAVRA